MKKNVKVILAVVIIAVLVCLAVLGVIYLKRKQVDENPNNPGTPTNQDKPKTQIVINEKYDVAKGMERAIQNTTLRDLENATRENEGKIDFSDLPGVSYEFISSITEENATEAWIIKLGNKNQYDNVIKKIYKRLDDLREQYKDVEIPNILLNNNDNIEIVQTQGIVIAVFAPDCGAIASGIEQTIYEQEVKEQQKLEQERMEREELEEIENQDLENIE